MMGLLLDVHAPTQKELLASSCATSHTHDYQQAQTSRMNVNFYKYSRQHCPAQ